MKFFITKTNKTMMYILNSFYARPFFILLVWHRSF